MKDQFQISNNYFMDDPQEGKRLEKKANPEVFVERYLKSHLDSLAQGAILEAGCGSGAFLNVLGRKYLNHSFIGIDISDERVAQANTKVADINNAEASRGSIYKLPFPDNYFDFIFSRFLYEYLQEPLIATRELFRVCKPGGKLLLQDLDGQFTLYPEVVPELEQILQVLKQHTSFDPNVGRKLYFFGKSAGFTAIDAEVEVYHKIFGRIDDFNYSLWSLKLEIAAKYLQQLLNNKEKAEQLKNQLLEALRDENTILFSNLITTTFIKK